MCEKAELKTYPIGVDIVEVARDIVEIYPGRIARFLIVLYT
jgi:hypothetical protein